MKQQGEPSAELNAVMGYNALIDSVGINVCKVLLDDDLTILWGNDNFYKSSGFTQAEYQSLFPTIKAYYAGHGDEFARIKSAFDSSLARGEKLAKANCRRPLKNGDHAWISINAMITDEEHEGRRVALAVYSDISDVTKLRAERDRLLDEKTRYFEWMMDEYVGNIYIADVENYELLFLNKTSCATLHITKEEGLGRKCYEVIQGRTSPCPFCNNAELTEEDVCAWEFDNPNLEKRFMIRDRLINWQGRKSRIELSHDMLSAEYKLAKKDLEREAILKTIPGGLARVDARDCETVMWYGGNFLEMLGYTAEQFATELNGKCAYVHPDDAERAAALMRSISETGEYNVSEFRFVCRSGEVKLLMVTFCYVSAEDSWDGIPSIYSVGLDVTEERQEQERQRKALEDAYQSLHVANLAKSNFLSSMSHDIRTPMNAIIGMTAIAKANLFEPEKVSGCLNKINVSSRHLLRLINEVLDMSKIESGKVDLMLEDVSLPDVVDDIVSMCRPLMQDKQQAFKVNIFNVRNEHVITDGDRLRQVFTNLLSNAIKYTPEGGKISLTINELNSEIDSQGRYEFICADNGIGMPEEYMQHIFEPFARANDESISKIQGTGLGLAITQNIVQMMNGTIEVQSRPGEGSTFTVTVPLALQMREEQEPEELAGLPVLVVDDELAVCESATMLLQELGMRSSWVMSGAEAVERVVEAHQRQEDFYAVILDWKMPDMDGLETVKVIRRQVGSKVPIIIISAYDYSNIEKEFIDAGADAFISKPLFKSKMLHVLQLFCDAYKTDAVETLPEQHIYLEGKRVLLAEDNELNSEIAVELLEMHGLTVETAENGLLAVERFKKSLPGYYDAVLMDIQMPVMDGYEATAAIRALPRPDAASVPILALTANAFVTDAGKAKNAGMNDHITKPINLEVLFASLRRWWK